MVDSSSLFFLFLYQLLKPITGLTEALLLFLLYRWGDGPRGDIACSGPWQSRNGVRGAWLQRDALHQLHVPSLCCQTNWFFTIISLIRAFNSVTLYKLRVTAWCGLGDSRNLGRLLCGMRSMGLNLHEGFSRWVKIQAVWHRP